MPSLILPPKVARERVERTRVKYRAHLMKLFEDDDPIAKQWDSVLKQLDPCLSLVRAKPLGYEPGFPVRPGFFYWLRDNPGAPPTVQEITGPDGEWCEPDSRFLDRLQSCDLQNPQVLRATLAAQMVREIDEKKALEADRAERQGEIYDRWMSATQARVSMAPGWSQNVAGRRGRTRGKG